MLECVVQGAQVIDGSGQTLLPGLIDAYTHVWNAQSLRLALMFGVTTPLPALTARGWGFSGSSDLAIALSSPDGRAPAVYQC